MTDTQGFDTSRPHSARLWDYEHGAAEIARFFDGLELLPPGVVPCSRWRPGADDPDIDVNQYCGVARKP